MNRRGRRSHARAASRRQANPPHRTAWRDGIGNGAGPGIVLDSVNGFRFQLLFNRDASATTVVRGLRVFAQS